MLRDEHVWGWVGGDVDEENIFQNRFEKSLDVLDRSGEALFSNFSEKKLFRPKIFFPQILKLSTSNE